MDLNEWQGLIGALAGVTITSLIGLLTAWLTRRWRREEREEGRREARGARRSDTYVAYLVQTQKLLEGTAVWSEDVASKLTQDEVVSHYGREFAALTLKHDAAFRKATLIAGPQVLLALEDHEKWFRQALGQNLLQQSPGFADADAHEKPLVAAMRDELKQDMGIRD